MRRRRWKKVRNPHSGSSRCPEYMRWGYCSSTSITLRPRMICSCRRCGSWDRTWRFYQSPTDTSIRSPDPSTQAVIWSCGSLPFQGIANRAESGFVRVKMKGIHFYSCYAPPSLTTSDFNDFLDRLVKDAEGLCPVAIAGNFNAWAVEWGGRKTKRKGQALLEAMSKLDLVLLNKRDKLTFIKGKLQSFIDHTFVSSNVSRTGCSWKVTDVYTEHRYRKEGHCG